MSIRLWIPSFGPDNRTAREMHSKAEEEQERERQRARAKEEEEAHRSLEERNVLGGKLDICGTDPMVRACPGKGVALEREGGGPGKLVGEGPTGSDE